MLPLYPLCFQPILQPRIWGGDRLGGWLGCPTPAGGPFGEAWVLSDRDDHPSLVAEGPLAGMPLPQVMDQLGGRLLGPALSQHRRFPLLLKFIDARDVLSVQVHPDDRHTHLLPAGERGKNEAWYVIESAPGRIYAGLQPGCNAAQLRQALAQRTVVELLASFVARPDDCVYLPAGTVHAIGGGLLLFEVQQNSDVTFRLYDWDRVDAKTGQPRQLHVEQSLACTDFSCGPAVPVEPRQEADGRERLVHCKHFTMWRLRVERPCVLGCRDRCRIVVGIAGQAQLAAGSKSYSIGPGKVFLLPAEVGELACQPLGPATLLEVALPE